MSVFVTSDCHFGHDRDFIWKARGFASIEEMNETIVSNWNNVVSPEDEVYLLGDVMLGGTENIEYVKRLNGKLHIVLGNHDTSTRRKLYSACENVVEVSLANTLKYKKYNFFLTHYPCITTNGAVESLKQVVINLFGHTHQTSNFYEDIPWIYHVGMDSHDCRPVNLDDAIVEMQEKFHSNHIIEP